MKIRALAGTAASLLRLVCLAGCLGAAFHAPAAGSGQAPPSDAELLSSARDLLRDGQNAEACRVLDAFFSRDSRDTRLDWEADVIREACRMAPPPDRRPAPLGGVNAVQVFVFDSPGLGNLEEELRRLKARGMNAIIVRAFHNRGDRPLFRGLPADGPGVYFRSAEAPLVADLLSDITRTAHGLGLRVFGWMTSRRSDWLIERHPEWLERQYDASMGRSVASRSLSIFEPGVSRSLVTVYRDLAGTGVDGILFQDDLIMRYAEGFSASAVQAYLDDTGRGVHPDDLFILPPEGSVPASRPPFRDWVVWKKAAVLSFLDLLVAGVKEVNPRVALAANVYYESLLEPEKGLAWYAQDIRSLSARVDYLAFMSYHRQMTEELLLEGEGAGDILSGVVREARRLAIRDERIIFKVQTTDWRDGSGIPEAESAAVREYFRGAGRFGTVVLQNGRGSP